jgi:hypothetical protein
VVKILFPIIENIGQRKKNCVGLDMPTNAACPMMIEMFQKLMQITIRAIKSPGGY